MKLKEFKIKNDYIFDLEFEDGIVRTVDMSKLIKSKVKANELNTAHIDKELGCLEFKNGTVDISPKTLYNFSKLNV